jgi:hypothetical protein
MFSTKLNLWTGSVVVGWALACGNPPRSSEASEGHPAPQLAVLRPSAGEIWTEGESYTIRWRATGIARVNVGLALGGKDKGHAALDLPGTTDSLRWRVPIGFVSGFGLPRADDVYVRVEDARDPTRFADSPSFTVVAPATRARAR